MSVCSAATTATHAPALDKNYNTATRYGVLIVSEGAPESLSSWHIWRFLDVQLSNRRLVDLVPMWLWRPLLYAYVLPLRLSEAKESYRNTWIASTARVPQSTSTALRDGEADLLAKSGSGAGVAAPVKTVRILGRRLEQLLREQLDRAADVSVQVEVAFYHGKNTIAEALERMRLRGNYGEDAVDTAGEPVRTCVEQLIILPLYPHYTSVRSASVWDAVTRCGYFQKQRSLPHMRFIRSYNDHAAYVAAWHQHIRRFIAENGKADWLFVVFEGLPTRFTKLGDTCQREYTHTFQQLHHLLTSPLSSAALSTEESALASDVYKGRLEPSRVTMGYLGKAGEPLMEPRIEKICLSILRKLQRTAQSNSRPRSPLRESLTGEDSCCVESTNLSRLSSPRSARLLAVAPTAYIVCPGVGVDDITTLWTIEQRICPQLVRMGWRDVRYIPALNDSSAHVEMLSAIVRSHLSV